MTVKSGFGFVEFAFALSMTRDTSQSKERWGPKARIFGGAAYSVPFAPRFRSAISE